MTRRPRSRGLVGSGPPSSVLVIAVVAIGVLVYGTNAVLNRLTGLDRGQRVGIATTLFFVALFALAWALRRLQQRRVI